MSSNPLPRGFYLRDPAEVAESLLGKLLVRRFRGVRLAGVIVEAEAYYGAEDPASRARRGGRIARMLCGDVGIALIYGVHGNWLFNVVAHGAGGVGAVLIRALRPVEGVEVMKALRGVRKVVELARGPGRLSKALSITKELNGLPVYEPSSPITIEAYSSVPKGSIARSQRIGVNKDLEEPLRFYIRDSSYVLKKCLDLH